MSIAEEQVISSTVSTYKLHDLTAEALRTLSLHLPPVSLLNFALTNTRIHDAILYPVALRQLISTYPLERRFSFSLATSLPPNSTTYNPRRKVPRRANQQHLHLALSRSGQFLACLPYDAHLRLINIQSLSIDSTHVVTSPLCFFDAWDLQKGRAEPLPVPSFATYADETGVDVEPTLEFSQDDSLLLFASPTMLSLFPITVEGHHGKLQAPRYISLRVALHAVGLKDFSVASGSGGALSPDGRYIASILLGYSPARVYLLLWETKTGTLRGVYEVTRLPGRRWSSLGWAKVAFTKSGDRVVVLVNAARLITRMQRDRNGLIRARYCRFVSAVFDVRRRSSELVRVGEARNWVSLPPENYGREVGQMVKRMLQENGIEDEVVFNAVHSSPGEATYSTLSFGEEAKHVWLVTKQPMFSMILGTKEGRMVSLPWSNGWDETRWKKKENKWDEDEAKLRGRKRAFGKLPWRVGWAGVATFAVGGRWCGGGILVEDGDKCIVAVRNITDREYWASKK